MLSTPIRRPSRAVVVPNSRGSTEARRPQGWAFRCRVSSFCREFKAPWRGSDCILFQLVLEVEPISARVLARSR
eukprot:2473583-Alexandrium_andersonii.AAC.1